MLPTRYSRAKKGFIDVRVAEASILSGCAAKDARAAATAARSAAEAERTAGLCREARETAAALKAPPVPRFEARYSAAASAGAARAKLAEVGFLEHSGNLWVSGQFRGLLTYAPYRRPSRVPRTRAEDDDVVSRCAPRVILLACLTSRPLAGRPSGCRTYARLPLLLLALLLLRRRAIRRPRWPPRSSHGPRSPRRSSHRRSRKTSLPPG